MAKKKRRGRRARQQQRKRQQRRTLIVIGAVVAIAIGGVVLLGGGNRSASASVDEARLALDPAFGPEGAPVLITEYGDFGCPSCRAWHNLGIREQILATYGDRVRFEFKDFPVITPQSPRAAEAGQCALDQGLFWEYHDFVYENYQGLSEANLVAYAAQSGLDVGAFSDCLDSRLHRGTVQEDMFEAQRLGIRGTPTFVVNGQQVVGAPYFETFAGQIEAILGSL